MYVHGEDSLVLQWWCMERTRCSGKLKQQLENSSRVLCRWEQLELLRHAGRMSVDMHCVGVEVGTVVQCHLHTPPPSHGHSVTVADTQVSFLKYGSLSIYAIHPLYKEMVSALYVAVWYTTAHLRLNALLPTYLHMSVCWQEALVLVLHNQQEV